jgi:hypothetical protein
VGESGIPQELTGSKGGTFQPQRLHFVTLSGHCVETTNGVTFSVAQLPLLVKASEA